MKKFRKLIPAFIMLLVSAILVSTATYAWFSMNTQVTATGMKVQATADSSLLIKVLAAADNTYSDTADVNMSANLKLLPTSTSNAKQFFKATAAAYNAYGAKAETVAKVNADQIDFTSNDMTQGGFTLTNGLGYIQVTSSGTSPISGGTTDGSTYALVAGYNVKKSDGAETDGLNIKTVSVTGNNAGLSDSLRVAVVMVNGSTVGAPVIIAPTRTSAGSGSGKPYETTAAVVALDPTKYPTSIDTGVATMNTANTQLGTIGKAEVKVYIFVYFEGQDVDNHSFNYDSRTPVDNITVSVTFGTY